MNDRRTEPRQCEECGKGFLAVRFQVRKGNGRFCSRACSARGYFRSNLELRFWGKIDKTTSCWIWLGKRSREGYGIMDIGRKHQRVHRISYLLAYGEFDQALFVCHHCDNPVCVRPDHLFLGDHEANMKDRDAKGRHTPPRGEQQGNSVLTDAQVREIRRLRLLGYRFSDLVPLFPVSYRTIRNVCKNEAWKHVR